MKNIPKSLAVVAISLSSITLVGAANAQNNNKRLQSDMVSCADYRGGILECDKKQKVADDDVLHIRTKSSDYQVIYKVASRPAEEFIATVFRKVTQEMDTPVDVIVEKKAGWEYRAR